MFDGEMQECLAQTDAAGETVCTARDGRHIKFPKGVNLDAAIKAHNKANGDKPEPADDSAAEAAAELEAFLNG